MHCASEAAPQGLLHTSDHTMYYDDSTPRNVLLSGFALGALLGASLILLAGPGRTRRMRRARWLRGA